eukprot:1996184-Prymnesium_polylepis.1
MSFKVASDPTAQGELIRKVYAKGQISTNISGDGLIQHATDLAADWANITNNSKEKPAGFYDALLQTLPTKPETSKVVVFRTWVGTKITDGDLLLLDIDLFLNAVATYVSNVGFPAESGNSVNAISGGGGNGGGGGTQRSTKCKLCEARCCIGTNFTTCLSFNKNLDFPENTSRGER